MAPDPCSELTACGEPSRDRLKSTEMHSSRERHLQETVNDLLAKGKANEARRIVEVKLSQLPKGSRQRQAALLDVLYVVELHSNRPRVALRILTRRRSLGFRDCMRAFDAALFSADLLMNTRQWFAARAELTELIQDPRCITWSGILDALASYVEADNRCREEMAFALTKGCEAAIKRFGIPLEMTRRAGSVDGTIRRAQRLFRVSAKKRQRLTMEILEGKTIKDRDAVIQRLKKYAATEKIGLFRDLAKRDLQQLQAARRRALAKVAGKTGRKEP
jgi:hypothetical protein